RDLGMQTSDQALFDLFKAGKISEEVALVHADSANDLRMMIKYGDEGSEGLTQAREAASHLSLRREDDF
ncbi:MAG: type IV pili twitching motility protein PilT, partial [Halomonas sp.]